jgi:LytR cell envelope-related transcriptional attenuator
MAAPTGSGIGGRGGSGVNSAVRGAGLVGLAVVLGIVLLQVIDKGPAGNGATPAGTSQATTPPTSAPAPASSTSEPATTARGTNPKARGEVRVIVFNAGAASGAAGNMTNKLRTLGYQLSPPANTNARRGTAVQCKQDFDKEAVQLQGDVGAGTTVEPFANPALPETENVNCVVLVGQ